MSTIFASPLLVHEMRKSASAFAHYARRGVLVALTAVVAWIAWGSRDEAMSPVAASMVGRELFGAFYIITAILTFLLLPALTTGLIAREVERKTLDLLFATPLTDRQIVSGKFFVQYLYFVHMLLLMSPIFVVTMMLGGIDLEQVFNGLVAILTFGFFCGAATLYLSMVFHRGTMAAVWFCIGWVLYGLLSLVIYALMAFSMRGPGGDEVIVAYLNPTYVLSMAVEPAPFMGPETFWICCGEFVALGALCLWRSVRRVHKIRMREDRAGKKSLRYALEGDGSAGRGHAAGRASATTPLAGVAGALTANAAPPVAAAATTSPTQSGAGAETPAAPVGQTVATTPALTAWSMTSDEGSALSYAPVWKNPVSWREVTYLGARKGKRVVRWLVVAYFVILLLPLCIFGKGDMGEAFAHGALGYSVTVGAGLLWLATANIAAVSLVREKEDKTLDLLLTTPMARATLLRGKARGVISAVRPLWIAIACTLSCGLFSIKGDGFVGAVYLVVVVVQFTFVSLCLGLVCSCLFSSVARATMAVLILLVGICALLPLLASLMPHSRSHDSLQEMFVCASPYTHISTLLGVVWSFGRGWGRVERYYGIVNAYLIVTTILAIATLAVAARRLARISGGHSAG